jgi:hypothetical protein
MTMTLSGDGTITGLVAGGLPNATVTADDLASGAAVSNIGYTPTNQQAENINFRNRIINGDMRIDQRNAGASVTPPNGAFGLDRWQFNMFTNSGKFSAQQNAGSVTPPAGFTNYNGITSLSAYSIASGDIYAISQTIEGFNTADLGFGTANAKTVTISFWVRSSLTGTFGGSLRNNDGNRSYPFSYTISAANTWEYETITIPGDTTGTWLTTNGIGTRLTFSLGVGSTYSGTAGAWAAGAFVSPTGATSVVGTNGATFYITGVQLEVGSVATPFERRPYGTELSLCQRYFWQIGTGEAQYVPTGSGVSENTFSSIAVNYPVKMRAVPTFSFSGLQCFDGSTAETATSTRSFYGGLQSANTQLFHGSLVTGRAVLCSLTGTLSYAAFSAEL